MVALYPFFILEHYIVSGGIMTTQPQPPFHTTIEALNRFFEDSWDLTADLNLKTGDPLTDRLDANWRRFRQAVLAALSEQEEITGQSAASAARNSVRTKDIQDRMTSMRDSLHQAMASMAEVAAGAREAAAAVVQSAEQVGEARAVTRRTYDSAQSMAESVAEIGQMLNQVSGQLDALGAQSKQVGDLSQVVRGIAQQVNLLSLNASIEAARAGVHGRTFAVVAQEVRRLADHTTRQANDIDGVIKQVVSQVNEAGTSMSTGMKRAHHLSEQAHAASRSAADIDELVTRIAAPFEELTATMEEHTATLSEISGSVDDMSHATDAIAEHVNYVAGESGTLLGLTQQAQMHLTRFYKGSFMDQVKAATFAMAEEMERVLTAAIESGRVTLDDVLALDYTEIRGAAIRDLSRLFDVSRVPLTGFVPPKFSTRYDSAVDSALQQVLDRYLQHQPALFFTGMVDLNGYQPITNSNTCKAWTGDFKADAMSNRLKRFSTDPAQLASGQMGLRTPDFASLSTEAYVRDPKTVLTRSEFLRLGNTLRQADDPQGLFTIYTYAGLSGKVASICAAPVYVKGHRYGAVMIGWEPKVGHR